MLGPTAPKIVGFSQDSPLLVLSQDLSSSETKFPIALNPMVMAQLFQSLSSIGSSTSDQLQGQLQS